MAADLNARVSEFVRAVCAAMGLSLEVAVEETPDNTRLNLDGEGGEALLHRKAEGLDALQHVVNTAFRKEGDSNRHFMVDYRGYRRAKDEELRQMAQFLAERAKATGVPQELGPLNPYARRVVHLAVAEDPDMTSESIGDAFHKTVIISTRKG